MPTLENGQQFLGTPRRMPQPSGQDLFDDVRLGLVRACVRTTRSIEKTRSSLGLVSLDPFVAGLSADTETSAELGHAEDLATVIGNEQRFLVHR